MLTAKKDLRTGRPVWAAKRKPALPHSALEASDEADVLVVGAGISGALVAEGLTDASLKVMVVDRRGPLAGSTSASTALLQHELDTPLLHLARSLGTKAAESVWRRSRLVVAALTERTARLGIEAELTSRDALYLAGDVLDARGLAAEAEARRRIGLEVELLSRADLRVRYGLRRSAGLLGFGDFVADPRQLAAGYLRVAAERGAQIHAPVDIVNVEENRRGVVATTSQGLRIRARYAVFATGYEVAKGVSATGHSVHSTWVIATRPQRRKLWATECMIWEASDPYLYLRTTSDGRVLCGGADEPFSDAATRDALSPRKFAFLERRLKAMFPALDATPDFGWAGAFGASDNGTPIIGRLPRRRRMYAVLGCGGNGITFSMLAAQLIANLITGTGDRDAQLFAPKR
jgi:glycine/D-amino acid oxidase-like deaminating enzyme